MSNIISFHTGDIHLTDKKPLARIDEPDWYEAQFRVLRWLYKVTNGHYLFLGGDTFDSPSVSFKLLNELPFILDANPAHTIAIAGNHEQPNKNSTGMNTSVFNTGAWMGLYNGITKAHVTHYKGVCYGCIPYTNSEEEFMKYVAEVQIADVIVMHKFVWSSSENSYVGASEKGNVKYIASLFPNAKVVFTSDNHKGFEYEETSPRIYNCGMLIRDNADLIDYQPHIYALCDDFSVQRINVPTEDDLITDRHIVKEKQRQESELVFLKTLSDSKDISYSFSDNLKHYTKGQRSEQYILDKYSTIKGKELTWEMI